jgi:biopolymer transport protein ExbD
VIDEQKMWSNMKYKPHRTKPAELQMTPIIDVIFLLLIFFMCTAHFYPPEEILPMDTTLPGSLPAEVVLPDPVNLDTVLIQIFFDQNTHWRIEGNQCSTLHEVQNILRSLRNAKPDIPVIIESADVVPVEKVIDIYDLCRSVGLSRIQFAAQ